ncbi:MAG: acyltransferase [Chitinophagales bacterium]
MVKSNRIEYLDSIRGIAAMMVVFYHFIGWHWGETQTFHLASLVFNGADAVSFFFVLSGFVLSYKYLHFDEELNIKKYTYNRVWRLYPAFIVTILLNYLYWSRFNSGIDILKEVFLNLHRPLWTELMMVRGQHMYYIPGWTLGIEMALSLLMPFLIIAAVKNIRLIWWFIPVSMFMGPQYISPFTMHFCFGIILAYYYPQIKDYTFKESKYYSYRWLIALVVFLLFSIRHIERMLGSFGKVYQKIAEFLKLDLFHFTGFASFVILLFVINNQKVQDFLNGKILHFIGKVSYSIYLMHWLIVVIIMERWERVVAFWGSTELAFATMLPFTIIATIASATFMYYFVEKPCIAYSKRVSSKFS